MYCRALVESKGFRAVYKHQFEYDATFYRGSRLTGGGDMLFENVNLGNL